MRPFNQRELKIIRAITTIEENTNEDLSIFLKKAFFTVKSEVALCIVPQEKTVILYIKNDRDCDRYSKMYELLELVYLIEYLKAQKFVIHVSRKQGGITLIHEQLQLQQSTDTNKIPLNDEGDYIDITIPDKIKNKSNDTLFNGISYLESENNIYDMILNHLTGLIYPTEELKQFVKNNFKTNDELNFKKQYKQTWFAIGLTCLLGIAGIFVQIYLYFHPLLRGA